MVTRVSSELKVRRSKIIWVLGRLRANTDAHWTEERNMEKHSNERDNSYSH